MINEKIKCFFMDYYHKALFRKKLRDMDARWHSLGGCCFGWFLPSFYYTHTKEEIEKITAQEFDELKKMIEQYKNEISVPKEKSSDTLS
jgi:hypothetical protein